MAERRIVEEGSHIRAEILLEEARGSINAAFDTLGVGFDHEATWTYLLGSPGFQRFPDAEKGHIAGLAMGFAITAVTFDREQGETGALVKQLRDELARMTEARNICKRQTKEANERADQNMRDAERWHAKATGRESPSEAPRNQEGTG